ncbi:MAG: hypothetical protein WCD83_03265, partial [Pseudolabrys sp.]
TRNPHFFNFSRKCSGRRGSLAEASYRKDVHVPPTSAHHLVPPLFIEWRVENDYKESAENGTFYLV